MSPLEKDWEGVRIFRNQETRIPQSLPGITPILYAPFPEGVLVAQSYGELFATKLVPKRWREEALLDFLAAGTVVFPEGKTFFEGVFEVPPGYDLHISGNKAFVTLRENLPEPREELGEEALPLLRKELLRAAEEIPEKAGLCLSGGLDSTALAAAWARTGSPRCFLYATSETPDKELALKASRALEIEPFILKAASKVSLEELKDMLGILEIPLHIPLGPLPQFRLLEAMKKDGVSTVYSGQGGDELFCGYPWHFPLAMKKARPPGSGKSRRLGKAASGISSLRPSGIAPYEAKLYPHRKLGNSERWRRLPCSGAYARRGGTTLRSAIFRGGLRHLGRDTPSGASKPEFALSSPLRSPADQAFRHEGRGSLFE